MKAFCLAGAVQRWAFAARTNLLWLTFACASVGFTSFARADVPEAFTAGNAAYVAGQFEAAIAHYEKAAQAGMQDAALFYNLGNSYFRQGDLGKALAAYRRAQWYAPRWQDLRANLRLVLAKRSDDFVLSGYYGARETLAQLLGFFSLSEWAWLALLGSVGWAVSLVLRRRRLRLPLTLVLAAACLCIVGSMAYVVQFSLQQRRAIVIAADTPVASGLSSGSTTLFVVQPGSEMEWIERNASGLRVEFLDGRQGWIPRSSALLVSEVGQLNSAETHVVPITQGSQQ